MTGGGKQSFVSMATQFIVLNSWKQWAASVSRAPVTQPDAAPHYFRWTLWRGGQWHAPPGRRGGIWWRLQIGSDDYNDDRV
jgi:hypothetical protein